MTRSVRAEKIDEMARPAKRRVDLEALILLARIMTNRLAPSAPAKAAMGTRLNTSGKSAQASAVSSPAPE